MLTPDKIIVFCDFHEVIFFQDGGITMVEETIESKFDARRVHVVVYVCDCTSNEDNIRQKTTENLKRIQDKVSKKGESYSFSIIPKCK